MISGAPASGKGTQCELIVQKFGLVHISTGDLLRAEVAADTEIGIKAKEYMNTGRLVPDEIVTAMVRARLSLQDAKEKGWLLDGYPRTSAQAQSLEELGIRPDVYIVLQVPDEILINRCVGRRLDPVTGKIYHINNFPPETEEIKERLVTRPDDTEIKVKSRLETYKRTVEAVLVTYMDIVIKIDGNRPKVVVFEEIKSSLSHVQDDKVKAATKENLKSSTGYALPGTMTVIMGPAKSGKSTLLRALTGRLPHSARIYGDIFVSGMKCDLPYGSYIGLLGEKLQYFTEEGANKAKWTPAKGAGEVLTWYKAYFDAPEGDDPIAIRMENMTKGVIWVNGRSIGRYWSTFLTIRNTPSQSEFAAALKDLKLWVMNVVPVTSSDTLPVIYERGLFGIYHD